MLGKLNIKRDKIIDIQNALKSADTNDDKEVDFEEWRRDLKLRGYAEAEIEAVFAKFDHDGDRVLNQEEMKKMKAQLESDQKDCEQDYEELQQKAREMDSDGDSDDEGQLKSHGRGGIGGVAYEEFTVLSRRVDRMEHSIGSIVSKIDAVLVKLEAMERAKSKRRETMSKILDSITEVSWYSLSFIYLIYEKVTYWLKSKSFIWNTDY